MPSYISELTTYWQKQYIGRKQQIHIKLVCTYEITTRLIDWMIVVLWHPTLLYEAVMLCWAVHVLMLKSQVKRKSQQGDKINKMLCPDSGPLSFLTNKQHHVFPYTCHSIEFHSCFYTCINMFDKSCKIFCFSTRDLGSSLKVQNCLSHIVRFDLTNTRRKVLLSTVWLLWLIPSFGTFFI